jgi:hypothetical protein
VDLNRIFAASIVVSVLVVSGCGVDAGESTTGPQCEVASVTVAPQHARPGEHITITGRAFWTTCADVSVVQEGTPVPTEAETSHRDLALELQHGGDVSVLGAVTASSEGAFTSDVVVPVGAKPGSAFVIVRPAEPVEITID